MKTNKYDIVAVAIAVATFYGISEQQAYNDMITAAKVAINDIISE